MNIESFELVPVAEGQTRPDLEPAGTFPGSIPGGDTNCEDAAESPLLFVFHDPASGRLAYKPDMKGARWRGGFVDMTEIADDCDSAGLPNRCRIEFVDRRD